MPIIPAIPAIIGAAGSIGGALLSKKAGVGAPSSQQNAVQGLQQQNLQQASGYANQLFPTGTNLLDLSKTAFQAPTNYWQSLLGGSRTGATSMLAPEISRITEGEMAARNTVSNLYPRSGASTDFTAGSIYAPQRAISSLLQTVRPQAATALQSIGSQTGAIGSYLTGDAMRTLVGGAQAGTGLYDEMLRQKMYQQQVSQGLGSAIGGILHDILKKIPFFNKSGSGSSTPSNTPEGAG